MNFVTDRINLKIFFISFGIGILICYLIVPTPKIVFSHPTPDNIEENVYYNSDNKSCYKYDAIKTKCDK